SWIKAAPEAISKPLYEEFVAMVEAALGRKVATGSFGADMKIELTNDGPYQARRSKRISKMRHKRATLNKWSVTKRRI
ncbi:MAG: D-aminoacyl-tRNA deacylase, partial [Alistipes sp.]|nr:D-aminoacyl-tRNA deacylase [Alistipes sp.]